MNDTPDAPFTRLVELTTAGTALGLRLFALNFALARNFHQSVSIPSHVGAVAGLARDERGQHPLIDVERDDRIGIDLKFGSITFKEEAGGTYAVALVDVMVTNSDMAPEADTRVQMNIRLAADPETDSILALTERFRAHMIKTLRAAAETLDATSARALVFHQPEAG